MATVATGTLGALRGLSRFGLGVPVVLLAMLAMITLPMPPFALDVLFTFNIALSMVVVLVTVYASRPLDFAVFPTVLLVATLLRLALNVASTRVVLLNGYTGTAAAGHVIEAFGDFVVGGNYAVGLVVFTILVVINFVVVTKGAGRVSEVSARFTLDAMPGKQMAIDADLNAGLITQDDARTRREEVVREADFYGSMDGASKFVRGDAIAGIIILFVNIIGGLVIGMVQHGMSLQSATHNYVLLTIGDGLVAQIPSLLLSTATAIIVTRVSAAQDMGEQVMSQLFANPRALYITAGVLGLLGLVPGMPNLVFLGLASLLLAGGYLITRSRTEAVQAEQRQAEAAIGEPQVQELSWDDVAAVDIIGLEVGYRLIPLVDKVQGGALMARIKGVRRKLSQELGFLVHPVHIRDNLDLGPNIYRISLMGVPVGEAEVYPERELAINPGQVFGAIQGINTRDPSFGLEAVWIELDSRDQAQTLGYTVVDPSTVIATHLSQILQAHAQELLGHEEVQHLLDKLGQSAPKLVENLTPKPLALGVVLKVLQNLLAEGVPIRDLRTIAESMAEQATKSQDADALTAAARAALGRSIVQQIYGPADELKLMTLDPTLEQLLHKSLQGGGLGLEPGLAEQVRQAVAQAAQRQEMAGEPAVLVVSPDLRPWLAKWLRPTVRGLNVLAFTEIPENKRLRVIATLGGNH
ncbi:flagellar biosynthesis protein FlhA [Acidihalobacter yilgarnensis]|uniref:Flagellar biosynthesis protein FlhA n=1 Tax=Acidihalobacter yilgarnensis TaxID=2819280 RepID=A0A1D8IPM2_9GAMM|nr:flagellar biosynthesis protein FlhA [Acidihalobacter yilgarnensis]AOU98458.1 flagellar biosynthesis protein FlhA [Acidihalobacter yilgarnensis]